LAAALRIDLRINAASASAAGQIGGTLANPANLNTALSVAGLPAATVLVAPASVQTNINTNAPAATNTSMPGSSNILLKNKQDPYLIGAAIGFAVLACIVIMRVNMTSAQSKSVPHAPMAPSFQHGPLAPVLHNPQLLQFANIPHNVHGRYYPIYDQSGQTNWHA